MSLQRLIFFVLSVLFFIATAMWLKDEFKPKWTKYQEKYYGEQVLKVEKEFLAATAAKDKELLEKRLVSLKKPVYEIKQILLKGTYSWSKQQNGDKVDRCMTCHIDEDKLKAVHPSTKELPFDIYGCTVCHGGIGRALSEEVAHEGMYYHKRQMELRLTTAEIMFDFWSELAILTPEESDPNERLEMGNFKKYSITGDKAIYVGSQKCLKCHKGLTSPHVERWQRIKFKTFERVKEAPDYIAGTDGYRKTCLKCHTTGYDEATGKFSEEGVTCEACHGAGEVFSYFMEIGKAPEGQKIAKVGTYGTPYNVCGPCHNTRNHEMRLKFFQERGGSDEWFYPQHTTPYKTSFSGKDEAGSKSLPKIQ
ncbi:Perchlorate reductase subunit gamma precursor [Candidatus Brocadiaceae bacterium B188]|jgi:hypothetical protein|nr:hypothetical protein [Candidatus Brocadia sapporoensis]MEB2309227.1 multiheme c-type cytochrome [Candidatus Brocadiaceae bacterium]OQZ03005.1 MAG: hypothetical protein B6D34_09115 [Candidatus Brocadia sp. UTAMX1]QQR67557.1 MAG: hypothetical protein IPI25_04950 [Candidatus Brocadia sp.]RZV58959.1 MAG: hypothetical protein EX330_03490 [Candidatus Brocadia sp. BROELEC01]TWU52380.1 Perchlorate reductase subunit gamma precursor [Candidatus Brocadiaceae bacterium B188]